MAITFRMPKMVVDAAINLDNPNGSDYTLANGVLTFLDNAGNISFVTKVSDLLSFSLDDYNAGVANIVGVDLNSAIVDNNTQYAMTIFAPNVINFFGGGKETGAIYQTRTYTVGTSATASTTELMNLFVDRINADQNAYFTASTGMGDVVVIEANDAGFGALVVTCTTTGSSILDLVPWESPIGTVNEVSQYIPTSQIGAAAYDRLIIRSRKAIRHNIVNGLQVIKPIDTLIFIKAGYGDLSDITDILSGAWTPADYLGCPQV